MTEAGEPAVEVPPPAGPKRYWTRRRLTDWLIARLAEDVPTTAGIDHSFSFPKVYFARHDLPRDWNTFLDDFHAHWPTDEPDLYVDFVRTGVAGLAALRSGEPRWRRRVEEICRAKSVFHFDVTGQVAKYTHAGLPFLRQTRRTLPDLHVWPYDGWHMPAGASCWSRFTRRDGLSQFRRGWIGIEPEVIVRGRADGVQHAGRRAVGILVGVELDEPPAHGCSPGT
ncbi:hypothetical protein [Falsirhodobacter deserti]|uniref:hypothetical protein n=1 Tax=Falsirhodobacter deserti TaxID=1365611 RepID=UPI0019D439DE|nr:hypothetical protein [Falsirhodobacter deserti]